MLDKNNNMAKVDLSLIDPKKNIIIKKAELHNLKGIDVVIPRNKFVVITGLSGSGKSTLAFDTLYAEGQRRYVESLSSYARQFLGRLDKPKVEYIKGIAPAIAIEQKVNTSNARSTVGTSTEIYDYIKLLYARIGETISPISGQKVTKDRVEDVVDYVKSLESSSKWLLLSPIEFIPERTKKATLEVLLQQGFTRVLINQKTFRIEQALELIESEIEAIDSIYLVVDRLVIEESEDFYSRVSNSVETAFYQGNGSCILQDFAFVQKREFSHRFEMDGMEFLEPNVHFFSFNNPYGACPKCEGYGKVIGIDPHLVIPDTSLSIYDRAIFPWRGQTYSWFNDQLINQAYKFDFPIHKPFFELSQKQKALIWDGNSYFTGLSGFFAELESKSYKIQNRVMLSRYRGKTTCDQCQGKRLRKEALYVKVAGKSVDELVDLSIDKLADFFESIKLTPYQNQIAKRLLTEITSRLSFLKQVGLGYLTLNRNSSTLSGGESQRINLATSLGSSLVGSMYILDEPSIGLHNKDNELLIGVLKKLRDLGNTVIVVEHDEEIIRAADMIIDIGPQAGALGGEVVAQGTIKDILVSDSLTSSYLNGKEAIEIPKERRSYTESIIVKAAREHNLKAIDVEFPLNCLTAVSGPSGSGKTTLIKRILYPAIQKSFTGLSNDKPGQHTSIEGNFSSIKSVEFVDQNPIGKSSRSNPVTYIKAYDDIRELFAKESLSKVRNYKPKHFSFNVDGGRCEICKGEGEIVVEMQFMADVHLNCESCAGKRFKNEILDVKFHEQSIDQVLQMTIDQSVVFFSKHKQTKLTNKLKTLQDVGLGYVKLGQPSGTLSGGEAQRVKLASFLVKGKVKDKVLFIFDEPTTGLHFHDIKKLLKSFEALIEHGHSIIVIEHNIDLLKCADYIIDLGPNGGKDGGQLVGFGTPEQLAVNKQSSTAKYLFEKLNLSKK